MHTFFISCVLLPLMNSLLIGGASLLSSAPFAASGSSPSSFASPLIGDLIGIGEAAAQQAAPVAGAPASEVFGPAPVPASGQPSFFGSLIELLPVLAVCYAIFYFMVIKPQETGSKSHKSLIESLKRGDQVVTSGGLVGKVAGSEKEFIVLELAANVKVKVEQAHVKKRLIDEPKAAA
jgi:preprotein translocase subunit YajC